MWPRSESIVANTSRLIPSQQPLRTKAKIVAKPIRAQDICVHLNVTTISRASPGANREKDQLLTGPLVTRLCAVIGNRGIAVLEVRIVSVRRETENETLGAVSVMANRL